PTPTTWASASGPRGARGSAAQLAWGVAKREAFGPARSRASLPLRNALAVTRSPARTGPSSTRACSVVCRVCGHTTPADVHAPDALARRLGDQKLAACADCQATKALLADATSSGRATGVARQRTAGRSPTAR